ncbi:MAG: hypothetical protein J3K34DRAFT_424235 [Monoraphidium minutum]|nr:MAG: hypothetical protein J3K34DRAFT_424235 [Monoraphidium minutum]
MRAATGGGGHSVGMGGAGGSFSPAPQQRLRAAKRSGRQIKAVEADATWWRRRARPGLSWSSAGCWPGGRGQAPGRFVARLFSAPWGSAQQGCTGDAAPKGGRTIAHPQTLQPARGRWEHARQGGAESVCIRGAQKKDAKRAADAARSASAGATGDLNIHAFPLVAWRAREKVRWGRGRWGRGRAGQ